MSFTPHTRPFLRSAQPHSPLSPCTLLKATLVFQPASALSFSLNPLHYHHKFPPPHAWDKERRVTVVLCSQVFSIAALGCNSTSPHTAAALPSLSLCSPIVHPPSPSLIHRPHRGSPFRLEERSVCVCACWCTVEYACLGETGCFRHLPAATPSLPPLPAPRCMAAALWLVEKQPLQTREWQTLLVHLFCHSLSKLPASVGEAAALDGHRCLTGVGCSVLYLQQTQKSALDVAAPGTLGLVFF